MENLKLEKQLYLTEGFQNTRSRGHERPSLINLYPNKL